MGDERDKPEKLERYRAKRSAERTNEPFGGSRASGPSSPPSSTTPRLFVCQKHGARRLHYDLRLEIDGVLYSWSVPRGPSPNTAQKRLAVETEPHPIEYVDFEGVIPSGNYGAGAMIVWDRGTYTPLEPFDRGYREGKLLFELHGYKLRGVWTLVRTKGEDNRQWLLIKKPDAAATAQEEYLDQTSVLSGFSLEELAQGIDKLESLRARLRELEAPELKTPFRSMEPMHAISRDRAFDDPNYLFELKYDGYRLLGHKAAQNVTLRLRRGRPATEAFPEVTRTLLALPCNQVVLDGEAAVLDDGGRPDFQRMQKRGMLTRNRDIEQARREHPIVYLAFDLLALEGYDLRPLPLHIRKSMLRELLPPSGGIRYCEHIEGRGVAMFEEVRKLGLEGIVAKRRDSSYQGTRSSDWIKIKTENTDDFVVVGYTKPQGQRVGLASLHLAAFRQGVLTYTGRVGTGFSHAQLESIRTLLDEHRRSTPACAGIPKSGRNVWTEPEVVCEVRYRSRTDDGMLRHSVFSRLRPDKPVRDCVWPGEEVEPVPEAPELTIDVPISNVDKVFWPSEGFTKGDLIDYYREISPWLLPYLTDRPLVLTRYPDGIEGKSFFQKNAPSSVPDWVTTHRLWSDHAEREIDYFVCNNVEGLVYLANLATIPIHVWASRLPQLATPDWCILDFDPKGAPFAHVIRLTRAAKELADEIGLTTYVKTSGSTGMHVLIPLGAKYTFEQCKMLGELLARIIAARHPDIATVERNPKKREGKVYVDFLQNGHGKLLAAPWCVRARPGATISTPLRWSEVDEHLDPGQFTIRTALSRVRTHGDPMKRVSTDQTDLPQVLDALARLFSVGR